jgi:hypothetical protein
MIMKKWVKFCLVTSLVLLLGAAVFTGLYAKHQSDSLVELRRKSTAEVIRLRYRMEALEDELLAKLDEWKDTVIPVGNDGHGDDRPMNDSTEELTVPEANAPETMPPARRYTVSVYDDMIGIYDSDGRAVRTVDVFVATLPEADREALSAGIAIYSDEELQEWIERYE